MKKKIVLTALACLTAALPAIAQTSVGFTDPSDIRPVLDYRLPAWGYSQ
jgi:hypothetical protein